MEGSFLRFYLHEDQRCHGHLAWEWLLGETSQARLPQRKKPRPAEPRKQYHRPGWSWTSCPKAVSESASALLRSE